MKPTYLLLFLLISTLSFAQDVEEISPPKLIIVLPNGELNTQLSKKDAAKFLFTNGYEIGKSLKKPTELNSLDVVIYDKLNSANNKEISFDQNQLKNDKLIFEYQGDKYEIVGARSKLVLIKQSGRGPASGSGNIKMKLESSSTPIECKNHSPAHRYYDGDKIRDECCFYTGCG